MTIFVERFSTVREKSTYPQNIIKIIDKEKMARIGTVEISKNYDEKELNKLSEYICKCIDDAVSTGEIKL